MSEVYDQFDSALVNWENLNYCVSLLYQVQV